MLDYGGFDPLIEAEDDPAAIGVDTITYDEMMVLLHQIHTIGGYDRGASEIANKLLVLWANSRPISEYAAGQLDDLEEQLRGE